jgi:hypothetical protein
MFEPGNNDPFDMARRLLPVFVSMEEWGADEFGSDRETVAAMKPSHWPLILWEDKVRDRAGTIVNSEAFGVAFTDALAETRESAASHRRAKIIY